MIILKATTESLQIITTTTADIDFSVSYVDITTTSMSPSTNEGKVTTATTTAIVVAPASSTQRQVKLVTISNRHASAANTIVVQKLISSTAYNMTPTATLLAGETMQYMDGSGWMYYSATGALKGSQTAAGSTTQIQYNNAGVLAGDANLTWDTTNSVLSIGGSNAQLQLTGVATTPTAPTGATTLQIFAQTIAGKTVLMKQDHYGDDEAVQSALWQNNVVTWTPSTAAGIFSGTSGASQGTATVIVPTATNLYTAMRRSTFASIVTTTNQTVGIRTTDLMFFRGTSANMGGFLFVCRFGFQAWTAGDRLFVGLSSNNTTSLMAANQVGTNHAVGFVIDAGDTAITFGHSDGTTLTKDTIAGQPALATNNAYDAYIYARPNDSVVYYRLDNALTGLNIIDTSTSTTLPNAGTGLMEVHVEASNGANTPVTSVSLGVNRIYVETIR